MAECLLFITDVYPEALRRELLINACKRAGLSESQYSFSLLDKARIQASSANVLVPIGEKALEYVTGFSGINKHHCTIMAARAELAGRKCVPILSPDSVFKDFVLSAYLSFGIQRATDEAQTPEFNIPKRIFHLNEDILFFLKRCLEIDTLAIDCETSSGDVTVVGIALSPYQAIAIDMRRAGQPLWGALKQVLEGPQRKVFHNFAYDVTCLKFKGIEVNNIYFDTMLAHKLLHPELEKNLGDVARIYTKYPYWKDDGHDWTNAHNWREHLSYNCCDTTATYAAYEAQAKALEKRGLQAPFDKLMRCAPEVVSMSTSGIAINQDVYNALLSKAQEDVAEHERMISIITLERFGEEINCRSPQQVKRALKELGISVPKLKGKETISQKALISLAKRYPKEDVIIELLRLAKARFQADTLERIKPRAGRIYSITDACYNEFGEWSGYPDIWGTGCYPPNLTKRHRSLFTSNAGQALIEVSYPQSELLYLAYDAPEPKLIALLANGGDVGRVFAGELWGKENKTLSRLAEKLLLRMAYGIGPKQLMELMASEHDKPVTLAQSKAMIAKCFELWPGLARRQHAIQSEIRRTKRLANIFGRERVFYDRIGDALFRQAYQWGPRATVAELHTELMSSLSEHWQILLHGNTYLLGQAPDAHEFALRVYEIQEAQSARVLRAGAFKPTVRIEAGKQWGKLERI